MFINPKFAIEQGWIKGIRNPDKQIQPNAIDFTLDILKQVGHLPGWAHLSETDKSMRPLSNVELGQRGWTLDVGNVYDGTSDMYVEVPEGVAAVLYTRSTLARNGVFLLSGLYDSGYKGHIGFTMYPIGGDIMIEPGTRVGQIAFLSAESAKMYAGGWNHEAGTHYNEKVTS
jgi:deoxycytidine triphosphate deaminase